MKIIILTLLAAYAWGQPSSCQPEPGQVSFCYSYEPPEVLASLHITTLVWIDVAMCNDSTIDVTLDPERARMGSPVGFMTYARAQDLLRVKQGQTPKARAAEVAQYALLGLSTAGGSGWFNFTRDTLVKIGGAATLATVLRDRWQSEIPGVNALLDDYLKEPVSLPVGRCTTRSVGGAKMSTKALRLEIAKGPRRGVMQVRPAAPPRAAIQPALAPAEPAADGGI